MGSVRPRSTRLCGPIGTATTHGDAFPGSPSAPAYHSQPGWTGAGTGTGLEHRCELALGKVLPFCRHFLTGRQGSASREEEPNPTTGLDLQIIQLRLSPFVCLPLPAWEEVMTLPSRSSKTSGRPNPQNLRSGSHFRLTALPAGLGSAFPNSS